MAYINPDLLEENWDALGDWADNDTNGAESSISPAGQLYLDCRAMTAIGWAQRYKDIGTIGTGNFWVEMRFKGDVWDTYAPTAPGISLPSVQGETGAISGFLGNNHTDGDGIWLYDSVGEVYVKVLTKTWDTNWHTIVYHIHNNQSDVDIWVDKDPATEAADATDAASDLRQSLADGSVYVTGYGTVAGNGEYHIDYLYIGTALAAVEYTMSVTVGAFTLTGIVALFTKALNIICSVGEFVLTGISAGLGRTYTMIVTVGEFTLTGIATIFTKALNIVVAVGEFTLTGIATTFTKALNIVVTVGQFTLSGVSVILNKGWAMTASVGEFVLTGITVNLLRPIINMVVSTGSFVLTGITSTLKLILKTIPKPIMRIITTNLSTRITSHKPIIRTKKDNPTIR